MMSAFWTLVKYLPEFIALAKAVLKMVADGVEESKIRDAITQIDSAFDNPDKAAGAKELNDAFRN